MDPLPVNFVTCGAGIDLFLCFKDSIRNSTPHLLFWNLLEVGIAEGTTGKGDRWGRDVKSLKDLADWIFQKGALQVENL